MSPTSNHDLEEAGMTQMSAASYDNCKTAFVDSADPLWGQYFSKSEPRHRVVNAGSHRSDGNHPQPPQREPSRQTLGQKSANNAYYQRSERSSGGPAVPVHRRNSKRD
jgi:hypothetical protein